MYRDRKYVKSFRIGSLILFLAAFIAVNLWNTHSIGARKRYEKLLQMASVGDAESIKRLTEDKSWEAIPWLERLADDPNAQGSARPAAITALGQRELFSSEALSHYLWIGQPFAVRRAAIDAFAKRKCDEACLSASLHALYSLRKGESFLEARLFAEVPPSDIAQQTLLRVREETMYGYFALLSQDSCATESMLKKNYASEAGFVSCIRNKIAQCPPSNQYGAR